MDAAAIYARRSRDDEGDAVSVSRQVEQCQDYCARRGFKVVGTFIDNDVSASRYARKKRPEYRRLLDAARDGLGVIVAQHIDRLYRQPRELEELIDLAASGAVQVHTLTGDIDLRTGDGRAMARVLVTMAAKSTDDDSRRWKALKEHKAQKRERAGGPRPFGYNADMTVRESEAEPLRQAARDVLAGTSVTSIAKRWDDAGVPTPQRGRWQVPSLRAVLTNPLQAGRYVHHGEDIGEASWDPILDETTHEALKAQLRKGGGRAPSPSSVLAGLAYCACGARMYRDKANGEPVLRCRKGPGRNGCGRCQIRA
ncbi:MAG: recombinase family protein, partial [Actinomycetota bacterium]|nr:recombinase family protein [Actinomycetota bacterium]